jgi:hypothetical protein
MVLVHINLDELTPRELGSERFEKRRDRAAWNAPGCGELHDDGAIAGRSEDGVELGLRRGHVRERHRADLNVRLVPRDVRAAAQRRVRACDEVVKHLAAI